MASRIPRQRKTFCTECGSELDEFWLSPESQNYEEVLKHHFDCQREGKFKGTMCSRLFIVDPGTPDSSKDGHPLSAREHTHLKKAILKSIEKEARNNGKGKKTQK